MEPEFEDILKSARALIRRGNLPRLTDEERRLARLNLDPNQSAVGDFAASAAHGLSLGLADNFLRSVGAPEAAQALEQRVAQNRAADPAAAFLSELAGGIALPASGAGLVARTGAGRTKAALAGGAGEAAVESLATSEGLTPRQRAERLLFAVPFGAATGGVVGGNRLTPEGTAGVGQRTEEVPVSLNRRRGLRARAGDLVDPARRAEIEELFHDPISGTRNQQAFERAAGNIDRDSQEIVMIDLTNFKAINDRLDHEVGNQRLAQVGSVLSGVAAELGVPARNVFRAGGDEFAVVVKKGDGQRFGDLARRALPDFDAGGGFISGMRFGVGSSRAAADAAMAAAKKAETGPRFRDVSGGPEPLGGMSREEIEARIARLRQLLEGF